MDTRAPRPEGVSPLAWPLARPLLRPLPPPAFKHPSGDSSRLAPLGAGRDPDYYQPVAAGRKDHPGPRFSAARTRIPERGPATVGALRVAARLASYYPPAPIDGPFSVRCTLPLSPLKLLSRQVP